jgi:hypothetical protein
MASLHHYSANTSIQLLILRSIVVTATTTGHANAGKHYKAYRIVSLAALMELNWIKVSRRCHGFTSAEVVPGETPQSYGLVASDVRCAHLNCTQSTATVCEHMMRGNKTIGSAGSFLN